MKFINEFFGFIVLTSPLWLIVMAALAAGLGTAMLSKRIQRTRFKVVGAMACFLVIFLIPFGDEIAGRVYLRYLCSTEAGVKVYHTVELPTEYWDEVGKPKFYDERNGNFHLRKEYPSELKIEKYSTYLHIDRRIWTLLNRTRDTKYAEGISFMYWGGWIRREFTVNNSAVSCGSDLKRFREIMRQVFKPTNPK
jgi:hypothetical protein